MSNTLRRVSKKSVRCLHEPIPLVCTEDLRRRSMQVVVADFGLPGTLEIAKKPLGALSRQPGSKAVLAVKHGVADHWRISAGGVRSGHQGREGGPSLLPRAQRGSACVPHH